MLYSKYAKFYYSSPDGVVPPVWGKPHLFVPWCYILSAWQDLISAIYYNTGTIYGSNLLSVWCVRIFPYCRCVFYLTEKRMWTRGSHTEKKQKTRRKRKWLPLFGIALSKYSETAMNTKSAEEYFFVQRMTQNDILSGIY